jgi:diacylglycerol kinase family enzyme
VVVLTPDRDLTTMVADAIARGADALGVAGGDGSLAFVPAAAVANGVSFTCIPAGTRNHFARDLGLDRRDPVAALDVFTEGIERPIDVAEVNGRTFLNLWTAAAAAHAGAARGAEAEAHTRGSRRAGLRGGLRRS